MIDNDKNAFKTLLHTNALTKIIIIKIFFKSTNFEFQIMETVDLFRQFESLEKLIKNQKQKLKENKIV